MITVSEHAGRVSLTMTAVRMGRDISISLSGGDVPHIGAVALAQPRPSLAGDGSPGASCSVLTLLGHKEDELARHTAIFLAKQLNATVCVACGIHVEAITDEEIGQVLQVANRLLEKMAKRLGDAKATSRV